MRQDSAKDFFISYTSSDRPWAEWIAWQLEAEGYTTILQAWDFRPGKNFILEMHQATQVAVRTLAVLSPFYLDALYTQSEWAAAFVQDPTGQKGTLLPVRVRECNPTGLFASLVYLDLVGLDEAAAHDILLAGIRRARDRPSTAPGFPGKASSTTPHIPSFPGKWPVIWNIPHRRNPFFTGRVQLLEYVRDRLTASRTTALTQAQAISGLGGIGKTQIALEYAYRYGYQYRFVLWISAATPETLLSDFLKLAPLLQISGLDAQEPHVTVTAIKKWLTQECDWLLILDNADDLLLASDYLPDGTNTNGHLLLTTRAQAVGTIANMLEVEKMDKGEGALLLLRRARVVVPEASLDEVSEHNRAEAEAIVTALDGLPLALDQAGAYIEETGCSLSDYLKLYQTRRKDLLGRRGQIPPGHPETVLATWSLSFQKVEGENRAAAELLRLCAFLAPDTIPEELLSDGAPVLGSVLSPVAEDAYKLNEAIEVLRRYSLLRRNRETKTCNVHRLVQAVLIDRMKPKAQRQWAERTVRTVSHSFPKVEVDNWSRCQLYLPHVQECARYIDQWDITFPEAAYLLNQAGFYLYERGLYKEAEPFYQRALAICEKTLGSDQSDTATSLNNLAGLYDSRGRYEQAEPLYQRALAIRERILGSEHPDTATTLSNLAGLFNTQGEYEMAEPLYQRALAIRERVLGPDHPDTIKSLNDLALLYYIQRKYEQAEPLYKRTSTMQDQALDIMDPRTATILNNLADINRSQGKHEQAELLYLRALAIREQILGPMHANTAQSLNSLAQVYFTQGKYEQAELLYLRALVIREQVLGPTHPHTAQSLHNLADLYRSQDKHEQAEPLYQRASEIKEPLRIMNLSVLADRCKNDLSDLGRGEKLDGRYCLEIFRRAIKLGDNEAWEVLQRSHNKIMLAWLKNHPLTMDASRIDDPQNYVDKAFERFWMATRNQSVEFTTLAAALSYLKSSLTGAILEELRNFAQSREVPLSSGMNLVAGDVEEEEKSLEMWRVIRSMIPDKRERRIAYLIYYVGLKPREIVRLFPQEFNDVLEVYRLNRRILERLLRNRDQIRWMLGD